MYQCTLLLLCFSDYQPNPSLGEKEPAVETTLDGPDPRLDPDRSPFVPAGKSEQATASLTLKEKKRMFLSGIRVVRDIPLDLQATIHAGRSIPRDPRQPFRSTVAEMDLELDQAESEEARKAAVDFEKGSRNQDDDRQEQQEVQMKSAADDSEISSGHAAEVTPSSSGQTSGVPLELKDGGQCSMPGVVRETDGKTPINSKDAASTRSDLPDYAGQSSKERPGEHEGSDSKSSTLIIMPRKEAPLASVSTDETEEGKEMPRGRKRPFEYGGASLDTGKKPRLASPEEAHVHSLADSSKCGVDACCRQLKLIKKIDCYKKETLHKRSRQACMGSAYKDRQDRKDSSGQNPGEEENGAIGEKGRDVGDLESLDTRMDSRPKPSHNAQSTGVGDKFSRLRDALNEELLNDLLQLDPEPDCAEQIPASVNRRCASAVSVETSSLPQGSEVEVGTFKKPSLNPASTPPDKDQREPKDASPTNSLSEFGTAVNEGKMKKTEGCGAGVVTTQELRCEMKQDFLGDTTEQTTQPSPAALNKPVTHAVNCSVSSSEDESRTGVLSESIARVVSCSVSSSEDESRTGVLSESTKSRTGVLSESAKSRTGVLSESTKSRTGVLSESTKSRTGVLSESTKSRTGVLSESAKSRTGVLSESTKSRTGVLSESAKSRTGVLSESAKSRTGVLSESAKSRTGVLSESAKSRTGVLSESVAGVVTCSRSSSEGGTKAGVVNDSLSASEAEGVGALQDGQSHPGIKEESSVLGYVQDDTLFTQEQEPLEPEVSRQEPLEPEVSRQEPLEPEVSRQEPLEPEVSQVQDPAVFSTFMYISDKNIDGSFLAASLHAEKVVTTGKDMLSARQDAQGENSGADYVYSSSGTERGGCGIETVVSASLGSAVVSQSRSTTVIPSSEIQTTPWNKIPTIVSPRNTLPDSGVYPPVGQTPTLWMPSEGASQRLSATAVNPSPISHHSCQGNAGLSQMFTSGSPAIIQNVASHTSGERMLNLGVGVTRYAYRPHYGSVSGTVGPYVGQPVGQQFSLQRGALLNSSAGVNTESQLRSGCHSPFPGGLPSGLQVPLQQLVTGLPSNNTARTGTPWGAPLGNAAGGSAIWPVPVIQNSGNMVRQTDMAHMIPANVAASNKADCGTSARTMTGCSFLPMGLRQGTAGNGAASNKADCGTSARTMTGCSFLPMGLRQGTAGNGAASSAALVRNVAVVDWSQRGAHQGLTRADGRIDSAQSPGSAPPRLPDAAGVEAAWPCCSFQ